MNILGLGTHIVECLRIAQLIERHGELFLTRVFTSREIEHCSTRRLATQHYASHWAGKEAIVKALGMRWKRGMSWRDIEIRSGNAEGNLVRLGGGARTACEDSGVGEIMVDLSYCRTHATAYAIALGTTFVPPFDDDDVPF